MAFDPTYRRSWATDFDDIHADVLTSDTRGMLRSLPSSLRSARHDLATMPPEDAVDALVGLQDLAAVLAADLATARARAEAAEARATLAEADARLMFATLFEVFADVGLALVEDMCDHGVTDAEWTACAALGEKYSAADAAALVAPMRRILGGKGE